MLITALKIDFISHLLVSIESAAYISASYVVNSPPPQTASQTQTTAG